MQILLFAGFSAASLVVSMVLIGISISEMVTSSFTKGELAIEVNCTLSSMNTTSNPVRCIAPITFEQKLVTSSLLIVFGFMESLVAVVSGLTTRDIFVSKYTTSNEQNANAMNMSVTEYFNWRLNQEPNTINNGTFDLPDGPDRSSQTGTSSELPDSDQFRSHLEGLGERNYGSA